MSKFARSTRSGKYSLIKLPDGRLMGYAEYGRRDGVPLLGVHGTPGSRLMLAPADAIASARGVRLIAPDRPGYGRSTAHRDYTLAQWSEDVAFLLSTLQIDRFLVFGVSGGGPFATALAAMMPQRVRGLALASPVGLFEKDVRKHWTRRHRLFFQELPRWPLVLKLSFPVVGFLVRHAPVVPLKLFAKSLARPDQLILSDPLHKEQLLIAFHEGFRAGVAGLLDDLQLFSNPLELPLDQITMPTLIWHGTRDYMVPFAGARHLAARLVDGQFITLEGQGHFWIFEHFEEVLERLLDAASP